MNNNIAGFRSATLIQRINSRDQHTSVMFSASERNKLGLLSGTEVIGELVSFPICKYFRPV
jgi:hypothetical protein